MTVGFFLVDKPDAESFGYDWAPVLIRSVRKTMPGVGVYQFTDDLSPAVEGIDGVMRLPSEPMAMLRLKHQASVDGEWVFVDTDVIFQKHVAEVFEKGFDIAVTSRHWRHLKSSEGFATRMPYNTGVVFSRCPAFFADAYQMCGKLSDELQGWMGDQQAIGDLVDWQKYDKTYICGIFDGARYNLPPACQPGEDDFEMSRKYIKKASIIHYKGARRKALLKKRLRLEAKQCA